MKSLGILLTCFSLINVPIKFDTSLDPIYKELMQDNSFASHEFLFNKDVALHREYSALLLYEHPENDLIFYVFNVTGFDILNPDDCRISLAYNSDNYKHHSLSYLGNTQDKKFYKFKINDFVINPLDDKREYKIAEFEVKQERIYENGKAIAVRETKNYLSSSISQSYTYTKDGYTCNNLTTITLDVNVGYKRTFGTTSSELSWLYWTDINYLYFNTPKNLGDLVGIKLDFYKTTTIKKYDTRIEPYYGVSGLADSMTLNDGHTVKNGQLFKRCYLESTEYKDNNNDKYDCIEYTDKDKQSIIGSSGFDSFISNLLNFSWVWGHEDIKDLKIIEKIDYDKLISNSIDYYLNDKDREYLINNPLDNLAEETWLIRFDFSKYGLKGRDNDIVAEKGGWDGSYTFANTGTNNISYSVEKSSYRDVDVITLTYAKDGKEYTLPVVSNTNDLVHGNETPSPLLPNRLRHLLITIGLMLLVVLLIPILPYVIQLLVWIILLPFKLIKWIINLFKKENKKKK